MKSRMFMSSAFLFLSGAINCIDAACFASKVDDPDIQAAKGYHVTRSQSIDETLRRAEDFNNPKIYVAYLNDKGFLTLPFKELNLPDDQQKYDLLKKQTKNYCPWEISEADYGFHMPDNRVMLTEVIYVPITPLQGSVKKYFIQIVKYQENQSSQLRGICENDYNMLNNILGFNKNDESEGEEGKNVGKFLAELDYFAANKRADYKMQKKNIREKEKGALRREAENYKTQLLRLSEELMQEKKEKNHLVSQYREAMSDLQNIITENEAVVSGLHEEINTLHTKYNTEGEQYLLECSGRESVIELLNKEIKELRMALEQVHIYHSAETNTLKEELAKVRALQEKYKSYNINCGGKVFKGDMTPEMAKKVQTFPGILDVSLKL